MPYANRKPKGRVGGSETAMGSAHFNGPTSTLINGRRAVRRVFVLGALAFGMAAAAGLLISDSARVARIEQARSEPESPPSDAGPVRIPIADQVQRQYRGAMGEFRPEERQRQNLENGIWRVDENARQGPTYEQSTLPVFPPQPTDEMTRKRPLRGDFWRPGEFYNLMGRPNDSFSR